MTVNKVTRYSACVLWFLLTSYCVILAVDPQLGPFDEYHFLPTLQQGKWFPMYGADFPYYDSDALGRFLPMAGQEYNIAGLFSRSPLSYYTLNVFELLLSVLLLIEIIKLTVGTSAWTYRAGIFVLLVPATTIAFFKLLYVDRGVFVFVACTIYAFIKFEKTGKPLYWLLALASANIAIYYKEPAFSIILAFSASHLILSWKTANRAQRILDWILIVSALIYLAIYTIKIVPLSQIALNPNSDPLIVRIKNIFNYAFFSDPLVVLGFIPLLIVRAWSVLVSGRKANPVLDSMLFAAVGYAAVFFVLNIYSPYYMLPAYMLGIAPFLYYVLERPIGSLPLGWKLTLAAIAIVAIGNSVPLALHYLTYNKYVPSNFHRAIGFLVKDINHRYAGERIPVYFHGVDRGTGRGVYYVVGEYLRYRGLSITKFDLKSDVEAREPGPFLGNASPLENPEDLAQVLKSVNLQYPQYPFSVFQPGSIESPKSGDYLVISPHSTSAISKEFESILSNDYVLVFSAEGEWAVPRVGLKTVLKQLLLMTLSEESKQKLIVNENLMNWPDYYIYVKR